MRSFLVALAAVMLAPSAWAARPLLAPVRDVTVTYMVHPGSRAAIPVEVAIAAGGRRLRITSPELPTSILVDRNTESAAILLPLFRAYSTIHIGRYDPQRTFLDRAHFRPLGPARVAGQACTRWEAVSADGRADGCITDDGVIVQGRVASHGHDGEAEIEATRVVRGPVAPSEFDIPDGFRESPFRLSPEGELK